MKVRQIGLKNKMLTKSEIEERLVAVEQKIEELYQTGQVKDWQLEHECEALETAQQLGEWLIHLHSWGEFYPDCDDCNDIAAWLQGGE